MKKALYYGLHTHWDREWYEPFEVYQLRLVEVLLQVLQGLERGLLLGFTLDGQTALLEDALSLRPDLAAKLAPWLKSGHLHVGPWFIMPDTTMIGLESLLRNLKQGMETAKHYGCLEFCGYLPDTFGHPGVLPTVFKAVGIETALVWRGRRLGETGQPWFWWQSPDGSRVLAHQLPEGYFQFGLHDVESPLPERLTELEALKTRLSQYHGPAYLPLGGDHLGPPEPEVWQASEPLLNGVTFAHPHQFLQAGLDELKEDSTLPTHYGQLRQHGVENGDAAPFLLAGTLSSRVWLKQANAQLENRLTQQLEPWLALTQSAGLPMPESWYEALNESWRLLLLNQPHDNLCGCSLDEVHLASEARYHSANALCDGLERRLKATWQSKALEKGFAGFVFNPSQQKHTGPVAFTAFLPLETPLPELPQWQLIETTTALKPDYQVNTRDVPLSNRLVKKVFGYFKPTPPLLPVSISSVTPENLDPSSNSVNATAEKLENDFISVSWQSDGSLWVTVKATGQTLKGLNIYKNYCDEGDSYNQVPVLEAVIGSYYLRKVTVLNQGPLFARVELLLTSDLPQADSLTLHLSLLEGSTLLQVEVFWQVSYPNRLLQVGFNEPENTESLWVEDALGISEQKSWHNVPLSRYQGFPITQKEDEWLPYGGALLGTAYLQANQNSLALHTEGLHAYEITQEPSGKPLGKVLWLTLYRGFGAISGGALASRGIPAGPPVETPMAQGLGRHQHLKYALSFGQQTPVQALKQTQAWKNQPFACLNALAKSHVAIDNDILLSPQSFSTWVELFLHAKLMISAVYPVKTALGTFVFRLINPKNEATQWICPQATTPVWLCNGLDEPQTQAKPGEVQKVAPHGLVTVQVTL